MASFQSQYGIRLSRDLSGMKWSEFTAFVNGLGNDSPLGRIITIRAENDPSILKHFSPEQRRIRNEWQKKKAKLVPQENIDTFLAEMQKAFMSLAGGDNEKNQM